ncbi:MAG: N-acetylneuraminate synthase family protein [Bryobacteraceae bacterium]|nr:N-acetylneuraminate synthase family protein [Bryobacteraceae bacterium]
MPTWFESKPRIIAEVGQAHDGSLGNAHAYIDAVARTGADAVKFQTHIAAAESTPGEPWRIRFSPQDNSRFDYWKRMEFTEEQWAGLAEHAALRGLTFLSSPFSIRAVELLDRLNVAAWKVGAGEITNLPMLERMAQTRKPVLLSSGLASWSDLDVAVSTVRRYGAPVGVFQCTTAYPCPPSQLGLNVMAEARGRYGCPVGLSDHSGTIFAGIAAATLGADMIEAHVVFSRDCFGPDTASSITVDEMTTLVRGVRFVSEALANPVDKESMANELADLKRIFGKSVVAARPIAAGEQLRPQDLDARKPGTGIPAARIQELVGCRALRDIEADSLLSERDVEYPAAT